jgi:two-component system cell cycle sensor histidine kinase/response regulator CckA
MRVLIADDIEANRRLLKATLEAEGVEVLVAEDGKEALEWLRREQVDAVISDVLMPNIDGFRLCHAIRQDKNLKDLPVILLSASYTSASDEKLALEYGADGFLKKPSPTDVIMSALRHFIANPRNRAVMEKGPETELERMKEYSERLVRKLKEKNSELELAQQELMAANRELVARSEETRKLASLVENSPDFISLATLSGEVLFVNPAGQKMLGIDGDDHARTTRIADYVFDQDQQALEQQILRTVLTDGQWEGEIRLRHLKGGQAIPMLQHIFLIKDKSSGRSVAIGTICRNITERKHLEEQLVQSQKMEAIGSLAGGIAHDFNNLLTAIIGYSQIALGRIEQGDPVRANIDEVIGAAKRAAALTGQLLAFSRKQVIQPRVLDLNEIVSSIERMLHRLIGEDIELITNLDPDLGSVKADPSQIEQVLLNFAVNSRDAMPKGGRLVIETKNCHLDAGYARQHADCRLGPHVMLAVTDTGVGMDKETQSRIFEPFFTTKGKTKGTGLGLSTVYGIVRQSGGHTTVHSERDRGTTFRVYLPTTESASVLEETEADKVPLKTGSGTILLVEDDKAVRSLALTALEGNGYSVIEAASAAQAELISQGYPERIDLLLTDVVMPGVSGQDVARNLLSTRPDMAVIYMSGYTEDAIIHHGVMNATMPFLSKPFTMEELLREVEEVLDRNRGQGTGNG